MISTYPQTTSYIERLIRYHEDRRIEPGRAHAAEKTARFREFLKRLGNPQKSYRTVVVSGTSGKGSTSYMIAAILSQSGYRVGLTQSPHLEEVTERIRIGEPSSSIVSAISPDTFTTLVAAVEPIIESMQRSAHGPPSYFEAVLGLALLRFAQEAVSIAVVEVGIEGRYDATTVLDPSIFMVSNISLDHTTILGTTIREIADEATNKITSMVAIDGTAPTVITAASQKEVRMLIQQRCEMSEAVCIQQGVNYTIKNIRIDQRGSVFDYITQEPTTHKQSRRRFHLSLVGAFQIPNAGLAITCIDQLRRYGFAVSDHSIQVALQKAFFAGRYEQYQRSDDSADSGVVIFDGAHNPAKMAAFIRSLISLRPHTKKVFIVGFKHDKNIRSMMRLIVPHADTILFTRYAATSAWGKNTGMDLRSIRTELEHVSSTYTRARYVDQLRDAVERALHFPVSTDIIVTGSLYLVGETRILMRERGALREWAVGANS